MVWSARAPVPSARWALGPVLAAFCLALAASPCVAADAVPADSAVAGASPPGTTGAVADTSALRAVPPPPSAEFQSAEWETLSAGLPEAAHPAPIFNFRYNRVDGAAVTAGAAIVAGEDEVKLLYGQFTYAFARERGLYVVGFNVPIGDPSRFQIGADYYRRTWNWDQWIVGETENTIFGLVAQTDYRDYWESEGWEGTASWTPGSDFKLSVTGRHESQSQLITDASFAIFKKPDGFRANPPIDEGDQGVLSGSIRIGPATLPAEGGTNVVVAYSRAGNPIVGDFEYDLLIATFHTRVALPPGQEARARLFLSSTVDGSLPLQQVTELGGIGTLRGFPFKKFSGDQMFLTNAEYYRLVRRNVYAFGFVDYGATWFGLDNLSRQKPSLDAGLGIRLGQGPIAVYAARSLQSSTAPILVGVRLGGSF